VVPYEYTFILPIWLRTAGGKLQFIIAISYNTPLKFGNTGIRI
jgi:hypothetical protein